MCNATATMKTGIIYFLPKFQLGLESESSCAAFADVHGTITCDGNDLEGLIKNAVERFCTFFLLAPNSERSQSSQQREISGPQKSFFNRFGIMLSGHQTV